MSSGYQEPAGGTSSPSTGTAVGSKPIRAWLKVLRNVDIVAEPGFGSTFIPKIKTPFEILSTSLRLHNPAQTFYTNIESAALLANQSIKVPIITATESGNKKDEVVLLKQDQSLENKTFPTYYDVTETATPANPSAGTLRIYANSTTHELTQRNSAGIEVKLSDGSGGGGGGAPTDAQYLTLGVNATLTGERVLTGSGRISITDAGPGVTATLDIPTGSIVDSYIGSHTSSKITITTKGQLNSNIVYTDQANTMGDFDQVFRDNRLRINNPADTFSYTIIAAAIGANRNLTLPLLTGNDTAVAEAFSQTLTNKTMSGSSNTFADIGDSAIASHTSTKITITTKGQLNSSIAYVDQANVFSDNDQSFRSARLRVANPANTFFYNFTAAAIAANRIINLPLLTATDTMVTEAFGQTLTNKTINASNNTVTNVGDSAIAAHTSTKITITAKGQLNSNILYGDQNNNFGGFYHDITEIAAPSNPSAGVLRIYANSTTHELTQRDSSGTEKKFSDGSGGSGAPTNSTYLVLSSDGTLSAERIATASSRVTITDAGANSTATFDIGSGSIVDAYIGSHTSTKISITSKGQLNSSIVYTDQANSFGDFAQTFKDNQLKINNPADTFAYTIIGAAIAANRNWTLPLLTGNDTAVGEAFAQTLTNKTIAAGSNTVSGIVDANIDTHTSSKITITTKGQLNSSIAYIDQANVFSDNDQSFRSNRLRIANPANTFFYSFTGAAIAASRIITLPLLTAGDTMVTEAFAQTLTNKTLTAGSNTITGLVDANLNAHTSTKVTITTKGQLNSAIVYTDQANTFGAFDQTFPTSRLLLGDSDASHAYIFAGSNLAANRTVTWPLLTGNDVPVLEAFSQTLTNKTINASNNTVTNIGDSAIAAHTSTKVTITAKGQLNSAILYNDVDNSFGAHYLDIAEITAPSNPGAGVLRVYANSTTHELTQRDSAGAEKKFSDGSGGGGAPDDATYVTLTTNGTLTNERTLTEGTGIDITDGGAGSTVTVAVDSNVAMKNAANTFTEVQTVSKVTDEIFKIYRTSNTNGNYIGMTFDANNSSSAQTSYANITCELTDNTAGAERGQLRFMTRNAGSTSTKMLLERSGELNIGPSLRIRLSESGLTASRTFTYPDASGEIATIAATQTLTNKTMEATGNNFQGVAQNPVKKRWGSYQPMAPSTVSGANVGNLEGILMAHVPTGPGTNTNTWDTTEGLLTNLVTTTTINQNAGLVSPTGSIGIIRREQAAKMVYKGKIDTVAGGVSRLYFGVSSNNALAISDTIANADSLVLVGFKAGATNYEIYHNDGSGAHATTTVTGTIAKNTSFHTIEMEWTASGNVVVTFDGTSQTISTDLPATSTNLFFHCLAQNATAAIRTHSIVGVWLEST